MCRDIVTSTFVSLLDRLQELRQRESLLSKRVENEVATIDVGIIQAIEEREVQLAALVSHVCSQRQLAAHKSRLSELHEHVWKANLRLQGILRRHRDASPDRRKGDQDGGLTSSDGGGGGGGARQLPTTETSAFRRHRRSPSSSTLAPYPDKKTKSSSGYSSDDSIDELMRERLYDDAGLQAAPLSPANRIPSRGRRQRTVVDDQIWANI